MCGYFYSNQVNPTNDDLINIRRRGPDAFCRLDTPLGHFAHSLLITKPPETKQPYVTKNGVLLYNGSTYNTEGNDTQWIASQLNHNIDDCVELIRQLRGEFSLTWVTDDFIIFCADQWVTRNLWFYICNDKNILSISSTPDVLRKHHVGAWPCKPNTIYILDKTKPFNLQTRILTDWNLKQSVPHYDYVWEEFEKSVDLRMHKSNAVGLSSGYDSAVIACALQNRIKKHKPYIYMLAERENQHILQLRQEIHQAEILYDRPEDPTAIENFLEITKQPSAETNRINWYQAICQWGINNNQRIHLTGRGGDEIYADYGFNGNFLDTSSTFGGYWPDQLDLVWPWHQGRSFLLEATSLQDFSFGFWGCEGRLPLLDQKLVQAWLNTTSVLKNKRYKGWMSDYMDQFDYPYCESDYKLSGFPRQ